MGDRELKTSPHSCGHRRLFLTGVSRASPEFGIARRTKGRPHTHVARAFHAGPRYSVSFRLVLSVQTVDATPSGIKLFSKVVFMKQGKRFGLSAEQKSDVWRRWKSGQTLHEIGRTFGKQHSSLRCLWSLPV